MWGEHCKMNLDEVPAESRQPAGQEILVKHLEEFLLWRGRPPSTGIRSPAQQGLISGFYARSERCC